MPDVINAPTTPAATAPKPLTPEQQNLKNAQTVPTPGGVPATAQNPSAAPPRIPSVVGKTISSVQTFQHGSVFVVDMFATDGNHYYIKTKQGALEIGGTADWDTGTKSST